MSKGVVEVVTKNIQVQEDGRVDRWTRTTRKYPHGLETYSAVGQCGVFRVTMYGSTYTRFK